MIPVVSVENMRKIEAAADESGLSYAQMMDNAGRAAAVIAKQMVKVYDDPKITLLIGGGNNGGDGLVCARYLVQQNPKADVRCYLLNHRDETDENFKAAQELDIFMAYAEDDRDGRVLRQLVGSADLIVDALFGIGVRLPIKGTAADILRNTNQALNERRRSRDPERIITPDYPNMLSGRNLPKVLAIDCPSGLDCNTGEIDSNAVAADSTISFIAAKPGLLTFPGAEAVGQLHIATIGIDPNLPEMQETAQYLVSAEDVQTFMPLRPVNSHKGTYGKAMVVAGSVNYIGAAGLAGKSAYRAGAGLVTIGTPARVIDMLAPNLPESTWLVLPQDMGVISENAASLILDNITSYAALLLGPGWGQEETTGLMLKKLLENPTAMARHSKKRAIGFGATNTPPSSDEEAVTLPPLIIDADGLNFLAKWENWWTLLPDETIITPHPGEMSRLSGLNSAEIQGNRWEIAAQKAHEWHVTLVLKGAHTLIAAPEHPTVALPFKTDALATAGSGDVLAGLICGLRAQGIGSYEAAIVGTYIHGLAGEIAANAGSSRAVTAADLLFTITQAWQQVETLN